MSGMPFGLPSLNHVEWKTLKLKGLARTQIPTNKNNDVEFPTFGAMEQPRPGGTTFVIVVKTSRPGKYALMQGLQNY